MRIQATSTRKDNLFQDDATGVSKLTMVAEKEFDQRFLTALFVLRCRADDHPKLYEQCRVFMCQWANSFPAAEATNDPK